MDAAVNHPGRLPSSVKTVAAYLILIGTVRFLGLSLTVIQTAIRADVPPALLGSYGLRFAGAAMVIFAGVALLRRKPWSRKFALGVLACIGYFAVKRGAIAFAYGVPATTVILVLGSLLFATIVAFALLLRRSSVEALS